MGLSGQWRLQRIVKKIDLTGEAFSRSSKVEGCIAGAKETLKRRKEPAIKTGAHCGNPYACGFVGYCEKQEPQAKYPVWWLPRIQAKALKKLIESGVNDIRDIPNDLLNDRQRIVKEHTLGGKTFFDEVGAAADLASYRAPFVFLDFETIQFAIPIWKGTRPYQQIPFQFSLHRITSDGSLAHESFLNLSGDDPARPFAEALIAARGEKGPVFVYNAGFETARIKELAERFRDLRGHLLGINRRIVDLLRIAERRNITQNRKVVGASRCFCPRLLRT